jgi:hypothetical protein
MTKKGVILKMSKKKKNPTIEAYEKLKMDEKGVKKDNGPVKF